MRVLPALILVATLSGGAIASADIPAPYTPPRPAPTPAPSPLPAPGPASGLPAPAPAPAPVAPAVPESTHSSPTLAITAGAIGLALVGVGAWIARSSRKPTP